MNYVVAGYGISLAAIGGYASWLVWRARKLTRTER